MGNKKSKIITLNEGEHVNIKKKYGKIYTEDDTSYLGDLNKDFEQNGHGIEYDENANIEMKFFFTESELISNQ